MKAPYKIIFAQLGSRNAMSLKPVVEKNRDAGFHFFEDETMKFFDSQVDSGLLKSEFFITSEVPPESERWYTIRQVKKDGSICSYIGGGVVHYPSLKAARAALNVGWKVWARRESLK